MDKPLFNVEQKRLDTHKNKQKTDCGSYKEAEGKGMSLWEATGPIK